MTWTYQAGGTTPNYAGLFQITGLRLADVADGSGNLPSFRPLAIPPISDTAPLRSNPTPVPRGGSWLSTPQFDAWQFDVAGWFVVDDVADVQAAIDYLHDAFTVSGGAYTATLNAPGWAEARQMTVSKTGPTLVDPRGKGDMAVPEREFTLTMTAADPLKYGVTLHTTTIGSGTSVTNDGNTDAHFVVRIDGPHTSYVQLDGPVGGGADRIKLNVAVASGKWVEIDTTAGTMTSNDSSIGYGDLSSIQPAARVLPPGSTAWTKSSGGGAGTVKIVHRSVWE